MFFKPLTILAATVELSHTMEGWVLAEPTDDDERRVFTTKVAFEREFRQAPVVQVALAGFDISNDSAARLSTKAVDITSTGFVVHVETWRNTRVWSVAVSWVALGT